MTLIETIAVIFGVLCVWLTIRQNIWCWPTGLVQVVLYIHIFLQVKLYSDVILHVIYVILQFYGWYHWLHGGQHRTKLAITRMGPQATFAWALIAIIGSAALGYFMASTTDASLPYPDAFTTVASLCAQWLMAKKRLESWVFWIVVDLAAIGIYYQKGLFMTSALYLLFLGLATAGFFAWRKAFIAENDTLGQ